MNQQTIDRIQPYIDEYCYCRKESKAPFKHGIIKNIEYIKRMNKAEEIIMQIIFEEHESNNKIEKP